MKERMKRKTCLMELARCAIETGVNVERMKDAVKSQFVSDTQRTTLRLGIREGTMRVNALNFAIDSLKSGIEKEVVGDRDC